LSDQPTDIVIVGAGAAGIGMGVLLQKMGLNFVILEKDCVGSSYLKWPEEMRFITPSFSGNAFGSPDLNAISPDTSPAHALDTEHPTGKEYVVYLERLVDHYQLPIVKNTHIKEIQRKDDQFVLITQRGKVSVACLIWAAGEFQYPKKNSFPGSAEYGRHTSDVKSWADIEGDNFCIVGGYESGMDAAVQLARLGKRSHVLEAGDPFNDERSDSSYSLSPYTQDRYEQYRDFISLAPNTSIEKITHDGDLYVIHPEEGDPICSSTEPLLATGFQGSLSLIQDLFEWENNVAVLTEDDESTLCPNLFLVGPQVCHSKAFFCFIYKFRQRFAIVAESIVKRQGLDQKERVAHYIEDYKKNNFYLKDLSCCEDECAC
jgi:putative flavoprotein involved in K+ transport